MTQKGHCNLTKREHRYMARLLQLHFETDPRRIARRWGVSVSCVRKAWREFSLNEMGSAKEAWQVYHDGPSQIP